MCFPIPKPKIPGAPAVPSEDAQAARARRAEEMASARSQQGRAATVLNTPLGDPNYGEDVRRTRLGGI